MITPNGSNDCPAAATVVPKLPVIADINGRLRISKVQRREILAAFARSGDSLPQFARRTGIKYPTLARWVQSSRLKHSGRAPGVRLVEAVIESSQAPAVGGVLVLHLPGGVRVEVTDERQATLAAMVVRALEQPC